LYPLAKNEQGDGGRIIDTQAAKDMAQHKALIRRCVD